MDSSSRYSSRCLVPDTTKNSSMQAFDSQWIRPFWASDVMLFDSAFDNSIFKKNLTYNVVGSLAVPPRLHNKNVLYSKSKFICRALFANDYF